MRVLIDTSVLSLVLRRKNPDADVTRVVERLDEAGAVRVAGPVVQELLTGVAAPSRFRLLRAFLRAFESISTEPEDFEHAAALSNACRAKGLAGSPTDFLLIAMCRRESIPIFTFDRDFEGYARVVLFRRFDHSPFVRR